MTTRRMINGYIWEDDFFLQLTIFQRLLWIGLVTVCADCHKIFHTNKKIVKNRHELPESKIFSILWSNGITYTSEEPWEMYGYGKQIIWEIVGRGNWKLFDRYNEINIKIVGEACENMARREFKEAMESDYYHGMSEREVRGHLDFWDGWHE